MAVPQVNPVGRPPSAPQAKPLPKLREDLRLVAGPRHLDGSPSWRVQDPVRNSFFEIGWLEFELLARWREHKSAASLAEHVSRETQLDPTEEEVQELVDFLALNQLLAAGTGPGKEALERKWKAAASQSWWMFAFHHYLFFRMPLFRPDAFLSRTVDLVEIFFTRGFLLLVLVVLCADLYLLSRDWHSFTEEMARMFSPQGLLYYGIAATIAKVVHEFAHAYAAKRYGVRVPTMGVAFLILWPYLYTDTGETWKLADRHKQLVIASAGMAAELALAVFSTLLWALSPEGAVKSVLFVFATTTWLMTLAINASPFMRFDGYFVVSDALDFPNLHERSAACARWWMRTVFFRLPEPLPEPTLSNGNRRWLIAFAITTWIYRLVVFLGIAVLVYHMFFKLLGIVMFVLELWWFIALPIWREVSYVWAKRKEAHIAWKPVFASLAVVSIGIWMVPVTNEVTAPAYVRATQEHAVYAPFPALVTRVSVTPGQQVQTGATLLNLEMPDLKVRQQKADVSIVSARAELARMPASEKQQERAAILEEQLAEALAAKQAVDEDKQRQAVFAEYSGTVRDVAPDLVEGRWVNPKQLLMRVVTQTEPLIVATISERQIGAVSAGQKVRFYPSQPELPVVVGVVLTVEPSPVKEVLPLLMASSHGGDIVVVNSGSKGPLVAQEPYFRVRIKPDTNVLQADQVVRGRVRIETDLRLVAENFIFRAISLLIREAGI